GGRRVGRVRCPAGTRRPRRSRPTPAPPDAEPGRSRTVPTRRRVGVVPQSGPRAGAVRDRVAYWLGLPLRGAWQMAHNGLGILRVLDITWLRPMPAGPIDPDHPPATRINPQTRRPRLPE